MVCSPGKRRTGADQQGFSVFQKRKTEFFKSDDLFNLYEVNILYGNICSIKLYRLRRIMTSPCLLIINLFSPKGIYFSRMTFPEQIFLVEEERFFRVKKEVSLPDSSLMNSSMQASGNFSSSSFLGRMSAQN